MKEINNIETDLPLDEWLKNRVYDREIIVKIRDGEISNDTKYKQYLTSDLLSSRMSNPSTMYLYDIMEIWDFSKQPKLLWKRGELLSEEEFMKEYERVFDNNVDWERSGEDKWCIKHDLFRGKITLYCIHNARIACTRYSANQQKAENFIKEYEKEIKKYLFGIK